LPPLLKKGGETCVFVFSLRSIFIELCSILVELCSMAIYILA
jgi:hypothetical protein